VWDTVSKGLCRHRRNLPVVVGIRIAIASDGGPQAGC
jgi:hypothetical protein